MSIKVMSWVLSESASRGAHRLVALALADFAHDDGRCWPGLARIAEKAAVSRSSVKRATADLIHLGELVRIDRGRHSNLYRFTFTCARANLPEPLAAADMQTEDPPAAAPIGDAPCGLTLVPQPDLVGSSGDVVGSPWTPSGLTVSPRTVTETLEETSAIACEPKGPPARKAQTRTRRRPDDEALTAERLAFARARGMTEHQAAEQWDEMGDHEFNSPRSDWTATWRNWCRHWKPAGTLARERAPLTRRAPYSPDQGPARPMVPSPAETRARLAKQQRPAEVSPDRPSLAGLLAAIGRADAWLEGAMRRRQLRGGDGLDRGPEAAHRSAARALHHDRTDGRGLVVGLDGGFVGING